MLIVNPSTVRPVDSLSLLIKLLNLFLGELSIHDFEVTNEISLVVFVEKIINTESVGDKVVGSLTVSCIYEISQVDTTADDTKLNQVFIWETLNPEERNMGCQSFVPVSP